MREQAGVIQAEVQKLLDDVRRLDDRTQKLQSHFGQAGKDLELIATSTKKITHRAEKIEDVQLAETEADMLESESREQERKGADIVDLPKRGPT